MVTGEVFLKLTKTSVRLYHQTEGNSRRDMSSGFRLQELRASSGTDATLGQKKKQERGN
jgi:hypothetical protein